MENKEITIQVTIPYIKINILNEEVPLTLIKKFDLDKITLEEAIEVFKEDLIRAYKHNTKNI